MKHNVVTMVIRQPPDPRARELMQRQLSQVVGLYGGRVTDLSQEDEMLLCELLKARLPAKEVEEARKQVAELQASPTLLRRHRNAGTMEV